jgi:hypothetical protein
VKRFVAVAVALVGAVALADTILQNGNVVIGPIKSLDCRRDAGLTCWRDAGSIGELQCNGATATEPGCVVPSAQTFAGTKTLTGDFRLVGHAHASLTACSSGVKGMWQTCTDHNAPVFCNGTANVELYGVNSVEAFPAVYVNGLLHSGLLYMSAWSLPYAYTVTSVSGFVAAGAGTTQTLRFTDGVNNCDCPVDCATGGQNFTCTGGCTFAASTQVVSLITSDGCTSPPTVKGILTPAGYR